MATIDPSKHAALMQHLSSVQAAAAICSEIGELRICTALSDAAMRLSKLRPHKPEQQTLPAVGAKPAAKRQGDSA